MVGLTLIALSVGVLGSVLSPSVVLDAVALWPVAALAVPAVLLGFRGGRARALAPLVILSWMLVSVGLHLGGGVGLPSTSATLRPELPGISEARLAVTIPDLTLKIEAGDLEIRPAPVGGRAGVPVVEQVTGSTAASLVVTDDRDRSRWFRFGEYRVSLPPDVRWDLQIRVASVDLDLSSVPVDGGRIEAATGRIVLGPVSEATLLSVDGDVEVLVPAGTPVRVNGTTAVPSDWVVDGDDAVAPVAGDGWVIRAESGAVRIVSR